MAATCERWRARKQARHGVGRGRHLWMARGEEGWHEIRQGKDLIFTMITNFIIIGWNMAGSRK